HILKSLKKITEEMMNSYTLLGIGASTAGIVGKNGEIQYAGPTIPGYIGTPIKKELEELSGLPVSVVNDVDAALLGEHLAGGAKGSDNVYCIALGTGIGGAYFYEGKLFSGAHAGANSIGYTLYDKNTKTDYQKRAATLSLEAYLKKFDISVIDAFEKAKAGDERFEKIIEDWGDEVARGVAEIILLFDPELILLGGAVAKQGEYLVDLVERHLEEYVPKGLIQTQIKVSHLANKAQLLGGIAELVNI
ncbi:ROK family protein, partial [Ligilactobacillus salivarius]